MSAARTTEDRLMLLSQPTVALLSRADWVHGALRAPSPPESVAEECAAALGELGARWSARHRCHLFAEDPSAALARTVATGCAPAPVDPLEDHAAAAMLAEEAVRAVCEGACRDAVVLAAGATAATTLVVRAALARGCLVTAAELPRDVLPEDLRELELAPSLAGLRGYDAAIYASLCPTPGDLERAAAMLEKADRVLLILGVGAVWGEHGAARALRSALARRGAHLRIEERPALPIGRVALALVTG